MKRSEKSEFKLKGILVDATILEAVSPSKGPSHTSFRCKVEYHGTIDTILSSSSISSGWSTYIGRQFPALYLPEKKKLRVLLDLDDFADYGVEVTTKMFKKLYADPFYTNKGSWDHTRIPLIKPYELLRLNGDSLWSMNLFTVAINTGIPEVIGINVVDSCIYIESGPMEFIGGAKPSKAWIIIDPARSIEKGFANKEDFVKYISSKQKDSIKFFNPIEIFSRFEKSDEMDWSRID